MLVITQPYLPNAVGPDPSSPIAIKVGGEVVPTYSALGGKEEVDGALVEGERTIVLLTLGQSLISNHVQGSYVCTRKVHNLSLTDGKVYKATQPLLGCSLTATTGRPSNYAMHLSDLLISSGLADRVIIAPIAIGGTSIADWAYGGAANHRLRLACNMIRSHGYESNAIILWDQGQSDHGTSAYVYAGRLKEIIASIRAENILAPFFISLSSRFGGVVSARIRQGQQMATFGGNVYHGPDIDSLGSAYRVDDTHLNQTGAAAVAIMWRDAIVTSGALS